MAKRPSGWRSCGMLLYGAAFLICVGVLASALTTQAIAEMAPGLLAPLGGGRSLAAGNEVQVKGGSVPPWEIAPAPPACTAVPPAIAPTCTPVCPTSCPPTCVPVCPTAVPVVCVPICPTPTCVPVCPVAVVVPVCPAPAVVVVCPTPRPLVCVPLCPRIIDP